MHVRRSSWLFDSARSGPAFLFATVPPPGRGKPGRTMMTLARPAICGRFACALHRTCLN